MNHRWTNIIVLTGVLCAAPAFADGAAPAAINTVGSPAVVAPATSGTAASMPLTDNSVSYKLAPDDVVSVTVIGFTDLTRPQVVVDPDGTINVPLLDKVHVAGETVDQASATLAKMWRKYVVHPYVTVSMVQKHQMQVFVGGFVNRPGAIPYIQSLHVMDAVAEAGDVQPTGDLSKVTLTHADQTKETLDLTHPERKMDSTLNPVVLEGDIVYVPEQRAEISVVGQVNKPGSYPWKNEMTVLDALTMAGDVTAEGADLTDATITHNGHDEKIDLDALTRHGDMMYNYTLQPGDRITVPEGNRTYVYGAVNHPGFYTFKPGDTVLDALNASGGAITGADFHGNLSKVNLIRIAPDKNSAVVTPVNIEAFLKKGDMSGDPKLQPGDVIYVASKSSSNGIWGTIAYGALNVLELLNTGASIATHGLGH